MFGSVVGVVDDITNINDAFGGISPNFLKTPEKRILSSMAQIKLISPNFGINGEGGEEIVIGEVDAFSASISFEVVKQFRPYGHTKLKTITRHGGWNINMSGGKVDWRMSYLVYMNERFIMGDSSNKSGISMDSTFAGGESASIGNQLLLAAEQTIKYYDGTIEKYLFRDISLLNYSIDMAANNAEIPESLVAFSPERLISNTFSDDDRVTKMKVMGNDIIALINQINKS